MKSTLIIFNANTPDSGSDLLSDFDIRYLIDFLDKAEAGYIKEGFTVYRTLFQIEATLGKIKTILQIV